MNKLMLALIALTVSGAADDVANAAPNH